MRVTLFHNPKSGAADHEPQELLQALRRHGYDAQYQSTRDDWQPALDWDAELIVIAGGDGTVDKVLPRLAGRGVPAGIVPVGSANNIATALDAFGKPADVIAGWDLSRRRPFDIGIAQGPWGTRQFVEAAGLGAFPQLMPSLKALKKTRDKTATKRKHVVKQLRRDADSLQSLFADCRPVPWQFSLDGRDASGEFLMVEALNIDAIGPGLKIAAGADPSDGLLDVVLVGEAERDAFLEYLDERRDDPDEPVILPVRRAEHVAFHWTGSLLHLDGDLWAGHDVVLDDVHTAKGFTPGGVTLQLMKHAVDVLIPKFE